MKPCIHHTFKLVNNRYYTNGDKVPEGADWGNSEWVTENVCTKCGCVLKVPEFYKDLVKK